ncbi:MAG TPA: SRPBCC family protein [Candidatus Saccharimonadales bacterium]|nr:SRPBCC family protein [Candidatus Saccharimonadales bacterium]
MQKPKLVYTTYIRSTPKEVWAAITKPEFTRQYWGGLANVSDWKKGSTWQHMTAGEKPEAWITGKVLECNPPERLVLSWADPDDLADKSRVTFEIETIKDAVCLTVTHDQFKAGSPMAAKVNGGWPRVLSSMKSFLETGKGLAAADCR